MSRMTALCRSVWVSDTAWEISWLGARYLSRFTCHLSPVQVFLFLGSLLQEVQLLPPKDHPSSSPSLYAASFTRIPNDFYLSTNRLPR